MKILKTALIFIFILIVVIAAGAFIFLKTLDIEKYKPNIIQMVSGALGRQVDFNDIDLNVSLQQGIRFHLTDFVIGESADFGTDPCVSVAEIEAGIDVFPFLLSRQVSVPNILLRSPRVKIIRNAQGILNVQTLGRSGADTPQTEQADSPSAALPAIFIDSFKIEDAELTLIDQSVEPQMTLAATQVSLDVKRFSLSSPFDVLLEAAVLAPQKNIRVSGKAQLKLSKNEVRILDTDLGIDLAQLPLDELRAFALFEGAALPRDMGGQIKVKIHEAVISEKGLGKLNADLFWKDGKISAPQSVPGILLEAGRIDLGLEHVTLDGSEPVKLTLKAALYQEQTNIDLNAAVSANFEAMEFHVTGAQFMTDLGLWPLEKIKTSVASLRDVPLPEQLSGKLQVVLKDAVVSAQGLKTVLLDASWVEGGIAVNNIIPGGSVVFSKINAGVTNFSLADPFTVSFKAAYLSEIPNIQFDGTVLVDLDLPAATVRDAVAGVDLDAFSLERFKASGLVPDGVVIPEVLAGKIKAGIHELAVSPQGLERITADIQWKNGRIGIREAAPGISVSANQIDFDVTKFSLSNPFHVSGSLGYENEEKNISFDGDVALDSAAQNIRLSRMAVKTELSQIPLERLKTALAPLKDTRLPDVLKGQVDVNITELSAGPQGLKSVLADIVLQGGGISMKEAAPGFSLTATDIEAKLTDFGLGTPFRFDIRLAYLSSEPNIDMNGTAAFYLEDQRVTLEDSAAKINLSALSMEKLKTSVAALKDVSLPETVSGQLSVAIAHADASSNGLSALSASGVLSGWEVKLRELAVPVSSEEIRFKLTENQFVVDEFQAMLGRGRIAARVGISEYLTSQGFDFAAEISSLNLAELLDQKDAAVKIEGLVTGHVKAKGRAADINSIHGEGSVDIKEAKLKDFNVLKTVLDKISFLPNVSSRVQAALPEFYKEKLNSKDTDIKEITAVCLIANGAVVINPIMIQADEFIFSGQCQAGFDQAYVVDGKVSIPAELSAAMAGGIEEMKYLYDENGSIGLPVHVTGKGASAPVVAVTQTAIDMGKNVIRAEGKRQLDKVLNKVFGSGAGEQPSEDAQNQQGEALPQNQESPSPEEQIIDGLFKTIFK